MRFLGERFLGGAIVILPAPHGKPVPAGYRMPMSRARQGIEQRVSLDLIRYASCWEDAEILCAALAPRAGARILSIASGGDNSLALAADGAAVVAVDLSAAQLALVELKVAAIRALEHGPLLRFLGALPGRGRLAVYRGLEPALSERARAFWRARPAAIARGVLLAGKFERFLGVFRRLVLPLIHSGVTIRAVLARRERAARERFYHGRWHNMRWEVLFRLFCGRWLVGRLGRDPEFFRHAGGDSLAGHMMGRVRHALVELSTHDNPFLTHVLRGWFDGALPRYLQPERFGAVRAGLDRLTLHLGPLEQAAAQHGPFDGFNLSDVFEYLPPEGGEALYGQLLEQARPGARLAYWNMLAPRSFADRFERARHLEALSAELFARDKAFFYRAFLVDEVPDRP